MNQKIQKLLDDKCDNYILPFFWQHGESEEVLRNYMKVIEDSNIKAVCIESRPHPDFCGPKWWQDMDVILDEARKRNMKVWILDDSHFPTGFANGGMEGKPDQIHRHSIVLRKNDAKTGERFQFTEAELCHPDPYKPSETEKIIDQMGKSQKHKKFDDDKLLGVYAICDGDWETVINLMPEIVDGKLDWKVPEGKWMIYTIHSSANFGYHRTYINMMDRKSCKVLLDNVYEPHYIHYADDFGTTIAGFFSDEPELGNGHMYEINDGLGTETDFPWSQELEAAMTDRLGENYALELVHLWETSKKPEETARMRHIYMDEVTRLVREDFSEQMAEWCHTHGVKYIGHVIEDNNHHSRTGSSLGHYFRGLFGQDMSGIDDIGGQVFPQGEEVTYDRGTFDRRDGEFYHYMLAKLASSAAAIESHKEGNSMCEIFGNYGWQEGVVLEKYLVDHFMVRGINHFVPHAFSPKAFPDPDCPPHFYAHGHNPQYRHFGALMAYTNRICELISNGKHEADVAILYHGEGEWTGDYLGNQKVGHLLYDHQIDFDIIPEDIFYNSNQYQTHVEDGMLHVHTQQYKILLVPYRQYLSEKLQNELCVLKEQGFRVMFIGGLPEAVFSSSGKCKIQEFETVSMDDLLLSLEKQQINRKCIIPANDRIRYLRYIHHDGTKIHYLVNEGNVLYKGNIVMSGDKNRIYEYDAWNNFVARPREQDWIEKRLQIELEPNQSILLIEDETMREIEEWQSLSIKNDRGCKEQHFLKEWQRSICESSSYPNFEQIKEVKLPDHLAEEQPEFSGFVCYENSFSGVEGTKYDLEISAASEGVEVFVNDESLGIQIIPTFRYDLSGKVCNGLNKIRIEIATTLERSMAKLPDPYGRIPQEPCCGSGITGTVTLYKKIDRN